MIKDVDDYVATCSECQKRSKVTYRDHTPISAIPRAELLFTHWVMDIFGPIMSSDHGHIKYNYCLLLVCTMSRYPVAFPLRSFTTKSVCDALLSLFMTTGVPICISKDNGTGNCSKSNLEFMKSLGASQRFSVPGYAQANGWAERLASTLKT